MTDKAFAGPRPAAARNVAVLGVGIMGSAMARNLLAAGHGDGHADGLPLLEALSHQWRAAVDAGHGREDVSVVRVAL